MLAVCKQLYFSSNFHQGIVLGSEVLEIKAITQPTNPVSSPNAPTLTPMPSDT